MQEKDQASHWDGDRVARWLRQAAGVEGQLAPVSEVLFAAARLQPGESVLDVGCGTGPTTYVAAAAVGPTGRVCGLDISGEMLAAAASAPPADADPAASAPIEWLEADPVTWSPPGPERDVVLSRFGVMFFSDPTAAFTNLGRAARAGGRLAFACWQRRDESELFVVPFVAALDVLRSRGITATAAGVDLDAVVAADGDGPFSLHDTVATTSLLERAGWTDVAIEPHVLDLAFGGGLAPVAAASVALDFGPTRIALAGMDDPVLHAAEEAIANAFAGHVDGAGNVVLSGAINIVTASRR